MLCVIKWLEKSNLSLALENGFIIETNILFIFLNYKYFKLRAVADYFQSRSPPAPPPCYGSESNLKVQSLKNKAQLSSLSINSQENKN